MLHRQWLFYLEENSRLRLRQQNASPLGWARYLPARPGKEGVVLLSAAPALPKA
jgi:hypothetical protein